MIDLSAGHGERTEIPPNYMEVAANWLKGTMRTARYPDTAVGDPIDWSLNPHDVSWLFRFHNMEYLFAICRAIDETNDSQYTALLDRIVHSWIEAHPVIDKDSMTWMRHTAALRAQALSYVASRISTTSMYIDSLHQHGEFLADPENYSGAWNHGLDESLALLAVGATVRNSAWIELAVKRAEEAVTTMCDPQGATNEQASVYHYYVWKQFGQLEQELKRCGIEPPIALQRRSAILEFLTHASQPDGYFVSVGDSLDTRVPTIPFTPMEYAASLGRRGAAPARRLQVFDRGWIFARTGWGTNRPYTEESLLTVRFGPGRAVHGHSDHTGFHYFTRGRTVIGDAGFSGYGSPERRLYELNEYGHSQCVVSGAGRYRAETATELASRTETPLWDQFYLKDAPYRGVRRERTITFVQNPEAIILHDTLHLGDQSIARQLLHVGPTLKADTDPQDNTVIFSDAHGQLMIQQLLPVSNIDIAHGLQGSSTTGWMGAGIGRTVPSTVLTTRGIVRNQRTDFVTLITPTPQLEAEVRSQDIQVGSVSIPIMSPLGDDRG